MKRFLFFSSLLLLPLSLRNKVLKKSKLHCLFILKRISVRMRQLFVPLICRRVSIFERSLNCYLPCEDPKTIRMDCVSNKEVNPNESDRIICALLIERIISLYIYIYNFLYIYIMQFLLNVEHWLNCVIPHVFILEMFLGKRLGKRDGITESIYVNLFFTQKIIIIQIIVCCRMVCFHSSRMNPLYSHGPCESGSFKRRWVGNHSETKNRETFFKKNQF